jgi:hypothetical protein
MASSALSVSSTLVLCSFAFFPDLHCSVFFIGVILAVSPLGSTGITSFPILYVLMGSWLKSVNVVSHLPFNKAFDTVSTHTLHSMSVLLGAGAYSSRLVILYRLFLPWHIYPAGVQISCEVCGILGSGEQPRIEPSIIQDSRIHS